MDVHDLLTVVYPCHRQVGDRVELRDDFDAGLVTVQIDHRDGKSRHVSIRRRGVSKPDCPRCRQARTPSNSVRAVSGASPFEI